MPVIDTADLDDYKAEHLLLLVGGNTLPNAIAAPRLVQQDGVVTLLCTKGMEDIATDYLLPYLKARLSSEGITVSVFHERMDDSRQSSICKTVIRALQQHPDKSVGLHYTTGTKAMAVHAHHVVSDWNADKGKPLLSYLSARNLRLYFDMAAPMSGGEEHYIRMQADQISLVDMLKLHGGEFKNRQPQHSVLLEKTAEELARISRSGGRDLEAWLDFKDGVYKGRRFKSDKLSPGIADDLKAAKSSLRFSDPRYLPQLEANLARCQPVSLIGLPASLTAILSSELTISGDQLDLAANKNFNKITLISDFYESVCGKWLEHYTLSCLMQANQSGKFRMHDLSINIEPTYPKFKDMKFELDVLGIKGYQLFGFSCAIERELNEGEGRAKWKLFEAIMRARQMGGEEARVAFVSLLKKDDCTKLENEASHILSEGAKIKVFGIQELLGLKDHIKNWITAVEAEVHVN